MIQTLEVKNFRNLGHYKVEIQEPLIIIEGPNGIGKTSLLESIYFASTTKSHRTNKESEMIQHGKQYLRVKLKLKNSLNEVILSDKGKRTFINKKEIRKLSEYIGSFHVVMFSPEDLSLIKGGPSERRYFMDFQLMQVSKTYLNDLNIYKKILKQRNALLKKLTLDSDYTFLNILSEQLYEVGLRIYDERIKFIENLNKKFDKINQKYKDFHIKLTYDPDVSKEEWLETLKTKQKQEIQYQQTLYGIHKDDIKIEYNGHLAKEYASQGTIRLIVIELKLAVLAYLKENGIEDAILLLDDVLSELDIERQQLFLTTMPKTHQVFITSATEINGIEAQKIVLTKEK